MQPESWLTEDGGQSDHQAIVRRRDYYPFLKYQFLEEVLVVIPTGQVNSGDRWHRFVRQGLHSSCSR